MKEIDKRTQEVIDEIERKIDEIFNDPDKFSVKESVLDCFPMEYKYVSIDLDEDDT